MNFIISKIILISLLFTLASYSKELWQSSKFEVTIIDNNDKNINEFNDSSFLILLDDDSLKTYEEHIDCFFNNNFPIDSLINDSIYSAGFLSTNSSSSVIKLRKLYYSDDNLIYFESENITNEGLQNISKLFFNKIDTLLLDQLVYDICETNIIVDRKPTLINKNYQKKNIIFNLLGQKMNKSIIKRTNKLNKYIYR